MPELDHILLADAVDQQPNGKLNIYGAGFDTIFAPSVPATHPQMAIVVRILMKSWETEKQHTLDLVLMGPDGQEVSRGKAEIEAAPDEVRQQLQPGKSVGIGIAVTLAGLVFPEYGSYQLAVQWDATELREPLRLEVALPPPAPPAAAPGPV